MVLIILLAVTRVPNPITGGKSFPIDEWGIAISVFEIAYIVITAMIVAKERNRTLQGIISKPSLIVSLENEIRKNTWT
ncbi:MAG: hypothetical protein M3Y53_12515 [Thermoproteota archaeon]|nr:hypothetical protein [Thermoproteota archaeon]